MDGRRTAEIAPFLACDDSLMGFGNERRIGEKLVMLGLGEIPRLLIGWLSADPW
jgi:hypothetical protein